MDYSKKQKGIFKIALLGAILTAASSVVLLSSRRYSDRKNFREVEQFVPSLHSVWTGFAAGLIGAAAALLSSPTSGKELRKKIRNKLSGIQIHSFPLTNNTHPHVSKTISSKLKTVRKKIRTASR